MPDVEITIIGAGVVGLAIAARLSRHSRSLVVLEKNEKYGMETSSRNSEVIHAGIYYPPGSLKARLCVEGRDELYALCKEHSISHRQCTKLITATDERELKKLDALLHNARANGVAVEMLDRVQTLRLEPNINAVGSLFSPHTGIISAHELMDFFYHTAITHGVTVQHRCEVVGIEPLGNSYRITISESGELSSFISEKVINAAGLFADHIAAMAGIDIDAAGYRLHFAKGSYFAVTPTKAKLVSRLVYPTPGGESLGVHAVVDWGGRLKFGPDIEYLPDRILDYRVDPSKRHAFGEAIRKMIPAIDDDDLTPDMAGIRPKLQRKGEPPKDFLIVHEHERGMTGFVNLIGIESPGLTASPAIARYVARLLGFE